MEEVGYDVVLGEVVEEHATDICRREVKLRGQQIRRDAKKAADAEVLPDAPETTEMACPYCVEVWDRYDRFKAVVERQEKLERANHERELRLKDSSRGQLRWRLTPCGFFWVAPSP